MSIEKRKFIAIGRKFHSMLKEESLYTKKGIREILEDILKNRYQDGEVLLILKDRYNNQINSE